MTFLKTMYSKVILILALSMMMVLPSFASSNIQIVLNGAVLDSPVAPVQQSGTTLVPIRLISENLKATVNYVKETGEVTITKGNQNMVLTLGETTAVINGEQKVLALAPQLISGTTMVPIRFVSENLNCTVNWDKVAQQVVITSKEEAQTYPICTLNIRGDRKSVV